MLSLALKNFFGAGLRTWLNIFALSFAYVAIIWLQGIGMSLDHNSLKVLIAEEIGGGHLWHTNYDPYDPLSIENSNAPISGEIGRLVQEGTAVPVLLSKGIAYPGGRMHNVVLRGIDPDQKVLNIPTRMLSTRTDITPVVIGQRTARSMGLSEGERFMLRWRNHSGALDAREVVVAGIMKVDNQSIDTGQIWLSCESLQDMLQTGNKATIIVLSTDLNKQMIKESLDNNWVFKSQAELSADVKALSRMKNIQYGIFYGILLFLALISIFDTQILALFRRRKEMGTLMSLGLTRGDLIGLFTLEGALYAIFAVLIGAVYGVPLFVATSVYGMPMPEGMDMDGFGVPGLTDKIYPYYSPFIITLTMVIVISVVVFVSYLPARKIGKLKPTDALRGKWS